MTKQINKNKKQPVEYKVIFNKPYMAEKTLNYIRQAYENDHVSGDGKFSRRCHQFLEEHLSVTKALLTTSGTDALEMMALLIDLDEGDEVIMPSFTFVSTANAFVLRKAKPVFIDIRPDTLNMDEKLLEELITDRTKAIVPVHYAGVGCEMDKILDIANKHNLKVLEDNAHGIFGTYKGKFLGTFGALAALSFQETKNFSCGEGGALLINDPQYIERAEIIRDKGTNRSQLFRGEVDKYTWLDVGSSFLLSDILAACLYAQLELREQIQVKRCQIWENYYNGLKGWAENLGVKLPTVPEDCQQTYHLFYMIMPSCEQRNALIDYLREHGIQSVFHYLPLHLSKMALSYKQSHHASCPVTEQISERLIRLPFYNDLTREDQDFTIETILNFQ